MNREEAKDLIRNDKDSYGKPKAIMTKIDAIYDEFEAEINNLKSERHQMASGMLSILDSIKLFDNDSLDISEETLSEIFFRKMKAYDIDLNKELGFTHLRPVSIYERKANETTREIGFDIIEIFRHTTGHREKPSKQFGIGSFPQSYFPDEWYCTKVRRLKDNVLIVRDITVTNKGRVIFIRFTGDFVEKKCIISTAAGDYDINELIILKDE
ncbi:MAG: hypothetical protein WC979_03035 [Candidatus Pacearchaeota archaeon]|jgi:hypothetical protein